MRHRCNRRHAAGYAETAEAIFKRCELIFQHSACGVAAARIVILAKAVSAHLLESGGLIDGRTHRVIRISRRQIEVDEAARELHRLSPKTNAKACSKSSIRSSGSSRPTERRISRSETPNRCRSSCGMSQ